MAHERYLNEIVQYLTNAVFMADKVSLQCVLPEDCCKVCAHK